ncbi:hypothetical protein KEM55_004691 [Ascosphaera atra]|nr:hypothetical protein KEM55_004691 [Ascosphaera atra]
MSSIGKTSPSVVKGEDPSYQRKVDDLGYMTEETLDQSERSKDDKEAAFASDVDVRHLKPAPDYEGFHRWDPEFEWNKDEEKRVVRKKIGAERWIPIQMVSWSLVAACQAFMKNRNGYFVCRALLGVFEGGL